MKINYTDKKAKQQSYDITELALDENDSGDIDFNFDVNHGLYRGSGILGSLNKLESASGYPLSGTFDVAGIHAEAAMMLYDLLTDIRFSGTVKASGFLGENSGYNEFADIMLQGDLKEIKADIKSFRIAGNEIRVRQLRILLQVFRRLRQNCSQAGLIWQLLRKSNRRQ